MALETYRNLIKNASPHEWQRGKNWYREANCFAHGLALKYNISLEQACGIIAVLSPMVEWDLNKRVAEVFIKSNGRKRGAGFAGNYEKARRILKENDLSVIRGPKVTAFYETMLRPEVNHLPVVDTHMIAGFYEGVSYRDDLSIVHGNEKRLEPIRQAIIDVANENGLKVQEAQAILWIVVKRVNDGLGNQLELWS